MSRLVRWLAAAFVPAAIGAAFPAPEYYAELRKPSWAPPTWLFGPAWTLLYLLMAIAAWLAVDHGGPGGRRAAQLWGFQLVLNAIWSPIFFGLRVPSAALVGIVGMWMAIAVTTLAFFRRHSLAGALMLPYLAWVTFATALNYEIWRRNR
ncbi:MAG: TspO/MBR family protein [Candidatus Limnocylindria bacterium]